MSTLFWCCNHGWRSRNPSLAVFSGIYRAATCPQWSCDSFVEDLAWDMATTAPVGGKGRGKLRPAAGADKCDRRRGPSCGEGGWPERAGDRRCSGSAWRIEGEGIFSPTELETKQEVYLTAIFRGIGQGTRDRPKLSAGAPAPISGL